MGMRVNASPNAMSSSQIGQWQQRQQNVKDLFASLKAGDLAGAQKAMSAIQGDSGNNADSGPFAAISKALASGDIKGAQQAAQAMHGHHHHHLAAANAAAPASAAANSGSGSLVATALGLGQNVNTSA